MTQALLIIINGLEHTTEEELRLMLYRQLAGKCQNFTIIRGTTHHP